MLMYLDSLHMNFYRKRLNLPCIDIPKSVVGRIVGQKVITDSTLKKVFSIRVSIDFCDVPESCIYFCNFSRFRMVPPMI